MGGARAYDLCCVVVVVVVVVVVEVVEVVVLAVMAAAKLDPMGAEQERVETCCEMDAMGVIDPDPSCFGRSEGEELGGVPGRECRSGEEVMIIVGSVDGVIEIAVKLEMVWLMKGCGRLSRHVSSTALVIVFR